MNLIVGGTGFVGGHLAEFFFREGEISKAIFRKGSHLRILDQCGIQCIEAEISDRSSLHEPLEGVDTIYNLASPTPKTQGEQDYMGPNTSGLQNLLAEANEHGVRKFVHLSTLDLYGLTSQKTIDRGTSPAPDHPYQDAKLAADMILLEFAKKHQQLKVGIVRAARAVGPRDSTLTLSIIRMAEEGKIVVPVNGNQTMSFSHPKDIAQALFRTATADSAEMIQLAKSFDASATELARTISSSCKLDAIIKRQGLFSKTLLPSYAVSQLKAALLLKEQSSWKVIGFAPVYDLNKMGDEVGEWYRRESWRIEEK